MTHTKKLKALIVGAGMSQSEVAKSLGISLQSFSYKLHNKREFKASEIESLCNILGITNKDEYFFAVRIVKMANCRKEAHHAGKDDTRS